MSNIQPITKMSEKKMSDLTPITVAYGDGIGPEIMTAVLRILEAAKAKIKFETIEIGEKQYLQGHTSGIPDSAWETLLKNKVFLKAPITTPQGGGYKSLNVTIRKTLSLFANVRACRAFAPYVKTHFPNMNLTIIRENEEDLYTGIEHRLSADVYQCLKLISRPGSERIIRYAFEYARRNNRKKVTCFGKDNIMKLTDGVFHSIFNEVAKDYPEIEPSYNIVDIGTALIADDPERFDVIVTENLYGDIISDVAAQVAGSVGMAGSANIGEQLAMFEAIHGSAPDIAGKNVANPSGLLDSAIQMLLHINQPEPASLIQNAWLKTLEEGIHTGDIASEHYTKERVGTDKFADAIIKRLGEIPERFKPANYRPAGHCEDMGACPLVIRKPIEKALVGIDIFFDMPSLSAEELANKLTLNSELKLKLIDSRGIKVWPQGMANIKTMGFYRARFIADKIIAQTMILELLSEINKAGLHFVQTQNLFTFDGEIGFSAVQGA